MTTRGVALALSASAILVTALLVLGEETQAHRDVRVGICIPYYRGARCARGEAAPSYMYGQRITIKGKVRPDHGGTVRIERRKERRTWKVVARREIRDQARYRYVWKTRRKDADQGRPYKFRVILPGHDVSPVQKVYVGFGE